MAPTVRAAKLEDIPEIHSIYTHYVLNTVISLLIHPPSISYIEERFNATLEQNMPYLVAVDDDLPAGSRIIGYTYASGFRNFMIGYLHSAEMTIFLHPDRKGKGVGNMLMKELLAQLKVRKQVRSEVNSKGVKIEAEGECRQLLAIMSVDDEPQEGKSLRDWYVKWGFDEVGHLRKIGFKNGRWYDWQNQSLSRTTG